jgi:hypothetical protein
MPALPRLPTQAFFFGAMTDRKTGFRFAGLRYNEKAIATGAQTRRPGDAGPVRVSLRGKNLTGRFLPNPGIPVPLYLFTLQFRRLVAKAAEFF